MPNSGRPSFASRVVSATIDLLASDGIDAVHATAVAERASCTTGAIYSHWPQFNDLMIEVWCVHLWPSMRTSLDDLLSAAGPLGDPTELAAQVAGVGSPTRRTNAAISMMVAARRSPDWSHVVFGELRDWLDDERGRRAGSRRAAFAATIWGAQFLAGVCATSSSDWASVLRHVAAEDRPPKLPARRRSALAVDPAAPASDGDAAGRLITAATAEIVAVGYERASIAAIVQRADAGRATLYRHFDTLDDVLITALDRSINARFDFDEANLVRGWAGADPGPDVADVVVRYLDAERADWRHLRLEAHLVARRQPALAHSLGKLLDQSRLAAAVVFGISDGPERDRHDTRVHFLQALYLGLAIVANSLGDELDRPALAEHLAMVFGRLKVAELAAEAASPQP